MVKGGDFPLGLAQRLLDIQDQFATTHIDEHPVTEARHAALLTQLQVLADFIETARREVSAVGVGDIVGQHVPAATDELDAIVLHTAEATGLILDECETLEAAVITGPLRTVVTGTTARIYEACSFQDITGQRVAKVVHALQSIEAKVGEMLRVFGCSPVAPAAVHHPAPLLNGPQRSDLAMQQQEIDALLASFE